jgi:hypothetical protein
MTRLDGPWHAAEIVDRLERESAASLAAIGLGADLVGVDDALEPPD